ncbi:MAG TPA: hypothetical protein DCS93_08060 [Microscillaceae bacterium]|nr:hypothetical protein [Microscillaceae bacterium]
MYLEIPNKTFIDSNMLSIHSDVECIFSIDSNFGIQGQLFKLTKSIELDSIESLSILLGRLACIGAEWNYSKFGREEWGTVFSSTQILKKFTPTNQELFFREFNGFKSYFCEKSFEQIPSSAKVKPLYSGSYKFNGENVDLYHKTKRTISDPLKFDVLDNIEVKKVFVNDNNWNWNLWFLESMNDSFLFEKIIIS